MDSSSSHWLPLTEYALRSGMSISTLRRKIKSNTITYKMEEGRYLIKNDELSDIVPTTGFSSSDQAPPPRIPTVRPISNPMPLPTVALASSSPQSVEARPPLPVVTAPASSEMALVREELRRIQDDNILRWRALEARVAGLAKKLEMFSEQIAETKMLVKIFEEKLDHRA